MTAPNGHAADCEWHCDQNEHECNCTPGLLRQQHSAMTDVMSMRRISANPRERAKADKAIAAWHRVEAFLADAPKGHALPGQEYTQTSEVE